MYNFQLRALEINLINREMTPEEETLEKIKFVLSCGNESQAIRLIEQYGLYMQEEKEKQLKLYDVVVPKGTLRHKAKVLTKEEIEANRSNAYKYLDL